MFRTNLALGVIVVAGLGGACGGSGLHPGGGAGSGGAAAGHTGAAGASTAGQGGAAGETSAAGHAGTAGETAAAGTTGASPDAATADASSADAVATPDAGDHTEAGAGEVSGPAGDLKAIVPTPGCGATPPVDLVPGTLVRQTIHTAGTKAADCADMKCGAWMDDREYWVKLPTGYDPTRAYPLVIEGPGCGGKGNNLYSIQKFDSTVIRVGLTPSAAWQMLHATNPNQGCFDDKDGDDSVDFAFYEALHDKLAAQVCFDRNRVFAAGNSSGAWLANELGCKYAGDARRPIRGVMVRGGGLPNTPAYKPTCSDKPLAGIWIHQIEDTTTPFTWNIYAMNRALTVDSCEPVGVTYASAMFDPFPLSNGDSTACKRYKGCSELAPLVVCPLPGGVRTDSSNVVVPGWTTFLSLFQAAPLVP